MEENMLKEDAVPTPDELPHKMRPGLQPTANGSRGAAAATVSQKLKAKPRVPPSLKEIPRFSCPAVNIIGSNNVHYGDTFNIYGQQTSKIKSKSKLSQSACIKALLSSTCTVSKKHLLVVRKHLGKGWRDVGRALGYGDGELEQFVINHKDLYGIEEVIFKMVWDWFESNAEPTLGKLAKALYDCGQDEVLKHLAEVRTE